MNDWRNPMDYPMDKSGSFSLLEVTFFDGDLNVSQARFLSNPDLDQTDLWKSPIVSYIYIFMHMHVLISFQTIIN